eukprot:Em0001g1869a
MRRERGVATSAQRTATTILTDTPLHGCISQCSYYQTESANVKSRYACVNYTTTTIPNNAADCVNVGRGMWKEFPPTPGLPGLSAPDCTDALWSRDNQLGNGVEFPGYPNYYNWTVPNTPAENCVFRVQHLNWGIQWMEQCNQWQHRQDHQDVLTNNINAQATTATNPTRGYVFRQNPTVMPFYDVPGFGLQLAINTNQFGRTFQDRSHTFAIKAVPDNLKGATIYNLNVRGKRGNIVQVYPGVEYDFVPDVLVASVNSYIHVQWTGSNTNPQDNAGQGQAGTDRSNMVLLRSPNYPEGNGQAGPSNGHWGNNYPAHLDSNQTLLGWSRVDRQALVVLDNDGTGSNTNPEDNAGKDRLARIVPTWSSSGPPTTPRGTDRLAPPMDTGGTATPPTWTATDPAGIVASGQAGSGLQRGGEMSELDDAGTYFDLGPKQVTQVGTYYYLCTRNNNFSNRDQKSKIIVQSNPYSNARVGALGGFVTVSSPVTVQVEVFQNASGAQAITNSPNTPDYTVSAFTPGYRRRQRNGLCPDHSGGMFVAASSKMAIISVATVLVVIVVLATVVTVSLVVYFRVKKGAWQNFKTAVKNVPKLRRCVAGKV